MLDKLFGLYGRTIVVTGGYGQIGRAMANGLVGCGANVAIVEPNASDEATAKAFPDAPDDVIKAFSADVTDRASLEAALEAITKHFGTPAGLVNNAALDSPPNSTAAENGPFEDYPAASWERIMDVNVKGVFQCCQVFG